MLCKPSTLHGLSPYGDWTSLDHYKKAPGGFTHLPVAIDKFSKWIEALPIIKIKSE